MGYRNLRSAFSAIVEGNKIRNLNERKTKYAKQCISSARLCVHGNGSMTSAPALSLTVSKPKQPSVLYCFNLSPALNRHFGGMPTSIKAIFLTELAWKNISPGTLVLLSPAFLQAPVVAQKIAWHGPPGFHKYLDDIYDFLLAPSTKERLLDFSNFNKDGSDHVDENITVKKILLDPHGIENTKFGSSRPTLSYICQVTNFRRRLDFELLKEKYGIDLSTISRSDVVTVKNYNKLTGALEEGEDAISPVTCEMVHSNEVTKQYAPAFAVLDCPSEQHLDLLERDPVLKAHCEGSDHVRPSLVAHITPPNLFSSSRYQTWMKNFGGDCRHLVLNEENKLYYTRNDFSQIFTFGKISSSLFPPIWPAMIQDNKEPYNNVARSADLRYLYSYDFTEQWDVGAACDASDIEEISEEILDVFDEESDIIEAVNSRTNVMDEDKNIFPRLVVLGCGGTHDHKYRSQPGFLLQVDKKNSILLDCGERTLERIYMVFGDKAEDILSSIKLVLASHIHVDHHLDFFGLVERIAKIKLSRNESHKVFCMMPTKMCQFYIPFVKKSLATSDFRIFDPLSGYGVIQLKQATKALGLQQIRVMRVLHSVVTYGLVITTSCGKKVVYSSDTLPMCRDLINHGKDADLLIHDCLYVNDEMHTEAKVRKHSWLKGVLTTADRMGAKFTLLTHFNPWLPVQPIPELPAKYAKKAAFAYDFLSISLEDLTEIPKLWPAVNAIYRDSISRFNVAAEKKLYNSRKRFEVVENLAEILKS